MRSFSVQHRILTDRLFCFCSRVLERYAWIQPAAFLFVGLIFRLWNLDATFSGIHSWNEVYYVTIARNLSHFGFLSPYNFADMDGRLLGLMSGPPPFVPWLIYISSQIFGNAEWAARIPVLIFGMLSLGAAALIAKELYDTQVAHMALLFAAVMPGAVFFSRQINLDGPMTAFGLGSLWTLLVFVRKRRYRWVIASSILLSLAIFAKYTAVLFLPALAVVWIRALKGETLPKKKKLVTWLVPLSWLGVAVLPAFLWFLHGLSVTEVSSGRGPISYLARFSEWTNLRTWAGALLTVWQRTAEQVGSIFFYPLLFIIGAGLINGKIWRFIRGNLVALLLAAAWYAQVLYPASWIVNDGYIYPGLFGYAILLAYLVKLMLPRFQGIKGFAAERLIPSMLIFIGIIAFSCVMDYWHTYHSSYMRPNKTSYPDSQKPVNLVTPDEPFLSAKTVRNMNVEHKPVMADMPQTLYYAIDEYWKVPATWWWPWSMAKSRHSISPGQLAAIRGREYEFIVFAYQPLTEVVEAIMDSGYRRIAPAAWQKISGLPD
jgi:4-amino-4-deoxy-L-arabinose transferase-like glycosyltransferase